MRTGRLFLALVFTFLLFADGGTLVFTKQDGPYIFSLFSAPEPVRKGITDLSVFVERASDRSPVLDAQPILRLTHPGVPVKEFPVTHQQATNKFLYAATIDLPTAGTWRVDIAVGSEHVAGDLNVLPAQPPIIAYWPYFALLPLTILLFVLNQWLKRRRARPRARA